MITNAKPKVDDRFYLSETMISEQLFEHVVRASPKIHQPFSTGAAEVQKTLPFLLDLYKPENFEPELVIS